MVAVVNANNLGMILNLIGFESERNLPMEDLQFFDFPYIEFAMKPKAHKRIGIISIRCLIDLLHFAWEYRSTCDNSFWQGITHNKVAKAHKWENVRNFIFPL